MNFLEVFLVYSTFVFYLPLVCFLLRPRAGGAPPGLPAPTDGPPVRGVESEELDDDDKGVEEYDEDRHFPWGGVCD